MFLIRVLVLISCCFIPIYCKQFSVIAKGCRSILSECDCIKCFDKNIIEYHCPGSDWVRNYEKIVIEENIFGFRWKCFNVDKMSRYLPEKNFKLLTYNITISDCPVSVEAAKNIDFRHLKIFRIENSNVSSQFVDFVRKKTNHGIQQLYLHNVTFEENVVFHNFSGSRLKELDIVNVDFKFSREIIKHHRDELNILKMIANGITLLDKLMFQNFKYLTYLDLSDNFLVYLDNDIFSELFNLRHLCLKNNNIEMLDISLFRDLSNLYLLDLRENNLCLIHEDILRPIKSLAIVFFDFNKHLELDEYLFSGYFNLQSVTLRHSNLKRIPRTVFRDSKNLDLLDFEGNLLSEIPCSLFDGLENLQRLILKDNKLSSINTTTFDNLISLKSLNLKGNKIQRLEAKLLAPLVSLEVLDVSGNGLRQIETKCFAGKKHLRVINLSYNSLKYTKDARRKSSLNLNLGKLQVLDLTSNSIEDFPEELLVNKNKLITLDLPGNKIKSINVTQFWKVAGRGVSINLHDNAISHIFFDRNSLPNEPMHADKVSYVYMKYNPMVCDCQAKAFVDFVNKEIGTSPDWGILFVLEDLKCASPKQLEGVSFNQLSRFTLEGCPESDDEDY